MTVTMGASTADAGNCLNKALVLLTCLITVLPSSDCIVSHKSCWWGYRGVPPATTVTLKHAQNLLVIRTAERYSNQNLCTQKATYSMCLVANMSIVSMRAGPEGERRIRGSGIYAHCSLINHECAPNITRFDYFDSARPDSTSVHFRAMHDLPGGTEVVQSYCPLNWTFEERQQQCAEVYGFQCNCPRSATHSDHCRMHARCGYFAETSRAF